MEDILREILYELKKINHKLYESDAPVKVTIGEDVITDEDVIVEKVIDAINTKNRIQRDRMINV